MEFSACIFDLYGTLADICTDESSDAFWEAVAADAGRFGARYEAEALRKTYLALCADEVRLRAAALPDVPEAYLEPELLHVFMRLLHAGEKQAGRFAKLFRRRSTQWLRPIPHALETLGTLKRRGVRTYLLSNAQSCFTVDELMTLGIREAFDGIILSSDAGMKKPYRGLFELLLARYGIDRKTAVMIGNDAAADIAGADAAGLRSRYIHTRQSGERPDTLPESCTEIRDLSELIG